MRKAKPVIVHVNRQILARNLKTDANEPAIIVRRGRSREYYHEVELVGPVRMVHRQNEPLDCGARVWLEAADARPVFV